MYTPWALDAIIWDIAINEHHYRFITCPGPVTLISVPFLPMPCHLKDISWFVYKTQTKVDQRILWTCRSITMYHQNPFVQQYCINGTFFLSMWYQSRFHSSWPVYASLKAVLDQDQCNSITNASPPWCTRRVPSLYRQLVPLRAWPRKNATRSPSQMLRKQDKKRRHVILVHPDSAAVHAQTPMDDSN